ncbi:MAG: thiamine phosphate synthase [Acidobacteriota bacterium]
MSPELPAARLYAIADLDMLGPSLPVAVETMAAAGVGWIQLRAKGMTGRDLAELAAVCRARLVAFPDTHLWLDDRVDVAAVVPGIAGVHVGDRDLPPEAARRVLGPGMWIGQSTHDRAAVERAAVDPAVDVIAVGPVFPTTSKANPDPVVGLDLVRWARSVTDKPLVAIGGIDATRLASVLAAGADLAVVLSAVCRGNVGENCRRLLAAMEDGS